jgi:hypothetical protein
VSVPITLKRQNNYAGPVEVSLAIPAMPAGVTAAMVVAAADAADVQLVIQAGPDAPEGALENASIQARCGEIEVAAPILLKVVP